MIFNPASKLCYGKQALNYLLSDNSFIPKEVVIELRFMEKTLLRIRMPHSLKVISIQGPLSY